MLRLTTTEAYSLVLECFEKNPPKHTNLVDEIGVFINEAGKWSGYLHGAAERYAGFDIPHFISGTLPAHMGEIPCILVLPPNDKYVLPINKTTGNVEIPCTIIQWPGNGKPWKWRALICAKDDQHGLDYAIRCFNERQEQL